jgi:hypothetical protein
VIRYQARASRAGGGGTAVASARGVPHVEDPMNSSIAQAWLLGLGGIVGSGALATGLGYVAQVALAWAGLAG